MLGQQGGHWRRLLRALFWAAAALAAVCACHALALAILVRPGAATSPLLAAPRAELALALAAAPVLAAAGAGAPAGAQQGAGRPFKRCQVQCRACGVAVAPGVARTLLPAFATAAAIASAAVGMRAWQCCCRGVQSRLGLTVSRPGMGVWRPCLACAVPTL